MSINSIPYYLEFCLECLEYEFRNIPPIETLKNEIETNLNIIRGHILNPKTCYLALVGSRIFHVQLRAEVSVKKF